MSSSVAAPIIAEATSQPGSPLTTFSRLGKSLVRRLPAVRLLRAIQRATQQRQSFAENAGAATLQLLGVQSDLTAHHILTISTTRVSERGTDIGMQHKVVLVRSKLWHRVSSPLRARQALLSHTSSALSKALERGPTGRGYPQLTALWVRGAGWGVTVYWSGAAGSRQRFRTQKYRRARQWTLNWQRA